MFCRNCGQEVPQTSSFCPHCGVAAIADPARIPLEAEQFQSRPVAPLTSAPVGNGVGVAGFVCGLIGLILDLPLIFFIVGAPLCILGIIFGVIGRSRANGQPGVPHGGLSLAGAVCGTVGLAWPLLVFAIVSSG